MSSLSFSHYIALLRTPTNFPPPPQSPPTYYLYQEQTCSHNIKSCNKVYTAHTGIFPSRHSQDHAHSRLNPINTYLPRSGHLFRSTKYATAAKSPASCKQDIVNNNNNNNNTNMCVYIKNMELMES